ncbi:MAG: chemotaxis protein [Phyllobacteriaceae bacterium]|nr:chemotaxis protein [Phyllobacteriaceae bacterium]
MEISRPKEQKNGTQAGSEIQVMSEAEMFGMLDNAPVNIMYCGTDLVIKYLNPKSMETLRTIQNLLPVPVDQMVGTKIDAFHKNPAHQQNVLRNPANLPIQTIIEVGEHKLDLLVSAVYDQNRNYLGAMATWDIVTDKLKQENEMARIQSMMENMPINVMMCGLDFKINYINPKSIETLRSLQEHLPVTADKMIGTSIDIFHKNPEHQRRLLADDRNLPRTAKIKVGPETLDLLVSPIYDHNQKYIGPMLTWSVISEKVKLVDTLSETSGQLSSASEELSATASQLSKNSTETSEESKSAAAAAEEVSKGVQTVATNTEEMVASIKEIAKSSSEASEISKEAAKKASDTNATITDLGEKSQEIGNVIKVISSIAQQTNLLALNATIEAARAGDAGKGFAVVANEVKELARQTAKATEEITNKIGAIQDSTKGAVSAIGDISEVIEKVNNISMSIAAAVEQQTATTNEVSRVVQESSKGVEGIAQTVKVVANAADQSSTGANQTLDAAKDLSSLAQKLKELVDQVEV